MEVGWSTYLFVFNYRGDQDSLRAFIGTHVFGTWWQLSATVLEAVACWTSDTLMVSKLPLQRVKLIKHQSLDISVLYHMLGYDAGKVEHCYTLCDVPSRSWCGTFTND